MPRARAARRRPGNARVPPRAYSTRAVAGATDRPGEGHAQAYPRVREQVAHAVDSSLIDELDQLFPPTLTTAGRPWGVQAQEAMALMTQLAGGLAGIIEGAVLDQR